MVVAFDNVCDINSSQQLQPTTDSCLSCSVLIACKSSDVLCDKVFVSSRDGGVDISGATFLPTTHGYHFFCSLYVTVSSQQHD